MNENLSNYKAYEQSDALSYSVYINGYLLPLLNQMRTNDQLKKSKYKVANVLHFSYTEDIWPG